MATLNKFINNLIPDRFKLTHELKTKTRGVIITQFIVGTLLTFLGILFYFLNYSLIELYLNTGIGIFLLSSIFTLKHINKLESYVNINLTVGYLVIAMFTLSRGVHADAPFWFAILLSITVLYTNKKHILFWIIAVSLFLSVLFYLELNGFEKEITPITYMKKGATLFSYYLLVIAANLSFKQINKKKNFHHLEIISQHKKLLKERDDLMSIIAHDIKSPARRIEGLISIFDTKNLTNDQKEILDRLNNTAHESKQLIDNLLEATRYETNLSIDKISINAIINDLKIGFLPLASKKNIRIITRGLKSNLWVETSSYQLKRILDNLLSNAIKFSPFDTMIDIICVQNNTNTSISITDQGPGFSKEDELKMFQMFQKLSARPTANESSTGLGLSIVKSLSHLLKGKIKHVTQVGKGSTFTLVLPNKYITDTKNNALLNTRF